jgi:hypothetical protein
VHVVALVLDADTAAGPRDGWSAGAGAGTRLSILALNSGVPDSPDVERLELDPWRTPAHRAAIAVAGLLAAVPAWGWRWLLKAYWPELVWALRSFDPDVVDLRWSGCGRAAAERLRADLAPIHVVAGDADLPPPPVTWRRADPAVLVSVVLPVYNGARYLAHALETCLEQTHARLELIVVDDASTDATPEIIASFARADARLVALRNPENLRLPGALNVGFARARGALLTWTSHDNFLHPAALEVLARYLQSWPDVDFVYSDYTRIMPDGRAYVQPTYPPWRFRDWNVVGAYFLFRRAVWDVTGEFRRQLEFVEDYDYWVRAAKRFRLMRLHEPGYYHYREHDESMSSRAGDVNPLRRQIWSQHF